MDDVLGLNLFHITVPDGTVEYCSSVEERNDLTVTDGGGLWTVAAQLQTREQH